MLTKSDLAIHRCVGSPDFVGQACRCPHLAEPCTCAVFYDGLCECCYDGLIAEYEHGPYEVMKRAAETLKRPIKPKERYEP